MVRARERTTCHFRIPASGHLRPIRGREILDVASYVCGFARAVPPNLTQIWARKWDVILSRTLRRPTKVARPIHAFLSAALVSSIVLGCAGILGNHGGESKDVGAPIAARVDASTISRKAVDQRIMEDLFEEQFPKKKSAALHSARTETLEQLIHETLLDRAASEAGMMVDAWLEQQTEALPPITNAEVEGLFEQNKESFGPGATLDTLAPQLRAYLERRQQMEVVDRLRAEADVEILLKRSRVEVAVTGPTRGPKNAVVVMVEFSDYECPYCGRVEPTVMELLRRYPETLRLVYRHHPLGFHPNARQAAEAAVCAEEQDRFWDYHAVLFDNQRALKRDQLIGYAKNLGLDLQRFDQCMSSHETAGRIDTDIADASELGATGTPAFFINGLMLTGAQPIEAFEALIDEELATLRR
jgi:protein-disulfide isomerase